MFALAGSALGFFSSFLPSVMSFLQDRADKTHELRILGLQMEQQRLGHEQRLQEINVDADIREIEALYRHDGPSGVTWVDGLRASVRPVITYAFFLLFMFVEVTAYLALLRAGVDTLTAAAIVWDEPTQALFAAVMSFWFGNRALQRFRQG